MHHYLYTLQTHDLNAAYVAMQSLFASILGKEHDPKLQKLKFIWVNLLWNFAKFLS